MSTERTKSKPKSELDAGNKSDSVSNNQCPFSTVHLNISTEHDTN